MTVLLWFLVCVNVAVSVWLVWFQGHLHATLHRDIEANERVIVAIHGYKEAVEAHIAAIRQFELLTGSHNTQSAGATGQIDYQDGV